MLLIVVKKFSFSTAHKRYNLFFYYRKQYSMQHAVKAARTSRSVGLLAAVKSEYFIWNLQGLLFHILHIQEYTAAGYTIRCISNIRQQQKIQTNK